MSFEAQHNAIRARFAAQWGTTTPVAWPNVKFTPGNELAWVRFTVADASGRQASMGQPDENLHRYTGLVTVQIFTKLGTGDERALELADLATGIFRGWRDASSGVRFRQAPYVRTVPGPQEKWHQLNVLAPFERDSFQ